MSIVYVIRGGEEDEETLSIREERGAAIPPIGSEVEVLPASGGCLGGRSFIVDRVAVDLRPAGQSQVTWIYLREP